MTEATLERTAHRCMTADELTEVTGFRSPSRQRQWVRDHLGIEPAPRADGRPSITWAVYEQARLARLNGAPADTSRREAPPNWNR
ncbi:DUF4224 domain-containing protein [Roseateles sp.]|uniref:DUF4224 domain-containing protein n=1 Tax=Roseateles sp. TaxID=1971397 RepID=UPI0039C97FBA